MDFYCMYNSHTKYCDNSLHPIQKNRTDSFHRQKKDDTFHVYYLLIYSLSTFFWGGGQPKIHHSNDEVCHVDIAV